MKRYLLRFYGVRENKLILALLLFLIASLFYLLYVLVFPLGRSVCINVDEGISANEVLNILESKGLIRNRTLALLYMRIVGVERNIMPVTFCVTYKDNLISVIGRLHLKGLKKVVVPEGLDSFEIADLLEKEGIIRDKKAFLQTVFDRARAEEILNRYRLPGLTLEGYLAPSTYYFSDGLPPDVIADRMVRKFTRLILPEFKDRSSMYSTLIIASIVQKETYDVKEMPVIAGVFYNRLRIGMPLQADPTVIYAIKLENGGYFDGNLKKRDLTIDSPYNTYLYPGLPPTPICNPGLEAVRATIKPLKTDYLYFVSMGNGSHFFSKDLRTHNMAVEKFIKGGDK